MLVHGGQEILRSSERFSSRAVLAVGWLEHLLRSSQLGVYLQSALSKAASQRLAGWRACMSQFNYVIQHIPGEDNYWGDLVEVACAGF